MRVDLNTSSVSARSALETGPSRDNVVEGRPLCTGKNVALGIVAAVVIGLGVAIPMGILMRKAPQIVRPDDNKDVPAYVTIPGMGSIQGFESGPLAIFRGLPYGRPPIGDLRWRAPEPPLEWNGTRMAKEYGSSCMGAGEANSSTESEDCLYLNVASPTKSLNHTQQLPVMLWIHGGSYESGSGKLFPLDANLVNSSNFSVVVVSINYRLNVFGFLGSDELMRRSLSTSAGNFGLEDQTRAMTWVRNYISVFGGDPKRVTLIGEGAGGNSIYHHLVMAMSNRLYARVIIQSGANQNQTTPLHEAQSSFEFISRSAGCLVNKKADLDCLLKKSAKDILGAIPTPYPHPLRWGPVIDGVVLKDRPMQLIEAGNFSRFGPAGGEVQLLIGSDADEWVLFMSLLGKDSQMGEDTFDKETALLGFDFTPAELKQVKEVYMPGGNYSYPSKMGTFSKWWWMLQRVATDGVLRVASLPKDEDVGSLGSTVGLGHCTAKWAAVDMTSFGTRVYTYLFDQATPKGCLHPPCQWLLPGSSVPKASEIDFVFDHIEGYNVSHAMATYWINFATWGNPNARELPAWPHYTTDGDDTLVLRDATPEDAGIHSEKGIRREACNFWHTFSHSCKFCGPRSHARGAIVERLTAGILV